MEYGLIIDLETSGLDPALDEIIEIGVLLFGIPSSGEVSSIIKCYGSLDEPSKPISPEIQKITGITNEALKGQRIDWNLVQTLVEEADILIAHNAPFDRGFLLRRPEIKVEAKHWACSLHHIAWKEHGFNTLSLNYLSCDHGFINPFAHRAIFDCATTFRLIQPYVRELIDSSFLNYYRIFANSAPYESKDILRTHGYRWDPDKKVWWKRLAEAKLETEREFLGTQVYRGSPRHQELPDAFWE